MAWINRTKPSADTSYLLTELGGFLLQENGDELVISYGSGAWSNGYKGSSTWTNKSK